MDLKQYIKIELDGLKRTLSRVLDTLTQEELGWRPACGCNSMGLLLFHIARSEDSFIQGMLQGQPQVWSTGNWYNKLNMAESERGAFYSVDQVNVFSVPDKKVLLDYYEAVRVSTLDYLDKLDPADFDKNVKLPFGEFTLGGVFSLIMNHTAGHMGEISYQRGMLRGMDK
jgi:hypothetical protein